MKQQYFTNTIISKFIKYLLAYSPLPAYPTIQTDDIIVEGCMIIKCKKTGLFRGIKPNQQVVDYLYVNEYLQVTDEDEVLEHYTHTSSPEPVYNSITLDNFNNGAIELQTTFFDPSGNYIYAYVGTDEMKVFPDSWGTNASMELVTEHAVSGNALKVVPGEILNYACPLKMIVPESLKDFTNGRYLRFHIYVDDPEGKLASSNQKDAQLQFNIGEATLTEGDLFYYADSESALDAGGTRGTCINRNGFDGVVSIPLKKSLWIDIPIYNFSNSVSGATFDWGNITSMQFIIPTVISSFPQSGVEFYFDNIQLIKQDKNDSKNPDSIEDNGGVTHPDIDWTYRPFGKDDEGHEDGSRGYGGLVVTDDLVRYYKMPLAEVEFVDYYNFGHNYLNSTNRFISNCSYYDSETHKRLGEYLRCLRDVYDLDLMGLYNCFSYNFADNFSLKIDRAGNGIVQSANEKTKVIMIPIKYNKNYTIAMDCPFPILMRSVIYDKVLLKDSSGNLLVDKLQENVTQINGTTFGNPINYSIVNEDRELQNFEKYLYLAIQVPTNLSSSIVVLEGRYSNTSGRKIINVENLNKMSASQVSELFRSNLSLLEKNDGKQYPFADKLISYLLRYTIDTREYIDDNVERVENAIKYDPPTVENFQKGIWDLDLRYVLFRNYLNINNKSFIDKNDITGFVDKDIENAAMKGWMDYAKFDSISD